MAGPEIELIEAQAHVEKLRRVFNTLISLHHEEPGHGFDELATDIEDVEHALSDEIERFRQQSLAARRGLWRARGAHGPEPQL